ncbi:RnfABCDGE type electron transport complex subunit D [Helicovermis profundi]|uniref:Ion-translocating oxidoreductase complex subunit D n=1 Tax=Helicovermis profundi TaxID=3065157 RepID=A0AAU9E916_9FIRM|nr:RnfABCDGE type electron transport complex subunit D [Clostridia bacterium S502]
MESLFRVSSSPHIRSKQTVSNIMRDVVIALLPATFAGVYYFGLPALVLILLSVGSAVATEFIVQKYLRKQKATIKDWSAVVTGMLLAFNIPSTAPWWLVVVGSAFAIAIVKQAFGGLGHNFMNPALAARAMLMASWPVEMTNWVSTRLADSVAGPTPLGIIGEKLSVALPSMTDVIIGNVGGCIGETSVVAILIGAAYLIYRGVISIRIPAAYIGTVFILAFFFTGFDLYMSTYNLFIGGLMLGAFFMATDYSSSPSNPKGQIIFGIGCGVIATVIRFYGGYPEGVSYSIILMNVASPLIEKYSSSRVFGGAKK